MRKLLFTYLLIIPFHNSISQNIDNELVKILPVFSDPAHQEQNGRHERMHRDLKAACAMPSAHDMRAQQRKLNTFLREYNQVRPHEALDMETAAKIHQYSKKLFRKG